MKRLACEICGSTDLIKQDGVFVCQSCGCKYSVEEVRRMMVEGTAEVTGTVKGDNTAAIENYLKIAKNALEASNNEEAENYANKIIELDAQNSVAWEIKGQAAGWQSKANNNRLGEAVIAWTNAVEFSTEEERPQLRERIANAFVCLLLAMVQLRANNFASIQDEERLNAVLGDLSGGIEMMNTLMAKAGVSFNRIPVYTEVAKKLNGAGCDGYKEAQKDFGPEHHNMSKWQWERFTARCDNCVALLEKAVKYCRDRELGKTICNNMITIAKDVKNSCSWKFDVNSWSSDHYVMDYAFTDEAKEAREKNIEGYRKYRRFFETNQGEKLLKDLRREREAEEIELGRKRYWQEHYAERTQLEAEKEQLKNENVRLESQLYSLPISEQMEETKKKKKGLQTELDELGLFKGKEKKLLQGQIAELEKQYQKQREEEATEKNTIKEAMNRNKQRIHAIDAEYELPRGRVSADTGNVYLKNAVVDGKFTVSPEKLGEHLSSVLPHPYKFAGVGIYPSSLTDFGPQWELRFINEDERGENKNISAHVYCAAQDEKSPIENIIIEGMPAIISNEKVGRDWGIIGSYVFMSLFEGMTQSEAEDLVVGIRHSDGRTLWTQDCIKYEYASYVVNLMGLVSLEYDVLLIRASDERKEPQPVEILSDELPDL